jgi:nucleotide-binding universal stress UspA family protein
VAVRSTRGEWIEEGGGMFALNRILVPTNLGEPSRTAIRYGVAFARQFGAKLFLLHVLPSKELEAAIETERVMEVLSPDQPATGAPVAEPDPLAVARNAARQDLGRLLTPGDEQDTNAEYLLKASGHTGAGDAIVACARELDVELIIMGKHRRGLVEHLLAGSVTEKVMRHAPCPVLIVQHPEHDFVVADELQHRLAR